MRRKLRKYALSGMFIVSLVLIMISISFSWFVNENEMKLWDVTAEVEEVQDLLVKDANSAFSKKIDIKYPEDLVPKMVAAGLDVDAIDALTLAESAGSSKAVNLVLMGRLSRYFDFTEEEWLAAIEASVPAKFLEMNKKAFTLGANA